MNRRRFLVLAGGVTLAATVPLVPAGPAYADGVVDYPEFPYPPTDYTEALRGQFHFSPRYGWMNDPNGLLWYDGRYHLFFQHNPHGLAWDTMHWGHATSPDLVHWTQHPVALEPGAQPGDLWSGAGVVDTANTSGLRTGAEPPIVVFTGTDGVRVCYSTDGARTFQSYRDGLVVAAPSGTSRDPKVLRDTARDRWVMVVWSDGGGNGADFYTSTDLLDWTFASRYTADWFFECPDLFALPVDGDTRWVLTHAGGDYVVGSFDGTTFSTDWTAPQRMDLGGNTAGSPFYAGQTFNDLPDGRVVQLVWQGGNSGASWTGNASFPAELALVSTPDGVRLTRNPIAELASLRADTASWSGLTVTDDPASDPFAGLAADTYEILAEFDVDGASATGFGFRLHERADGGCDRVVGYDRAAQTLYGAPLPPSSDGHVTVRLLVDRGQLEIFGNGGLLSYTDNVDFDSAPASQGLSLYATGGSVPVVSVTLHRLRSAWGTGESTLESTLDGPWRATAGSWTDVAAGKQGDATGDGFYLSSTSLADFRYAGDLRADTARACALTFRASADAGQHYTATIDTTGLVKLWRPGGDIATAPAAITAGRTYHLEVVATGPRLQVYLDHGTTPIIDATDATYPSGLLGANVYAGTGTVQNLTANGTGLVTNLAGPWTPAGGTWTVTEPRPGLRGNAAGDGFRLSATTVADGTYEGDLTVVNGVAAALTFRASPDAAQHYTATIDATGLVKLWRPGQDIATYPTPIVQGRPYHLKVVATGPRIQVSLDGTTVIDATDPTYSSGLLGVNVFQGSAVLQNLLAS